MAEPTFDVTRAHQWFAVELNNLTWTLMEDPGRTPDDTERMIHAAHAACYHWLEVGQGIHHHRAQVTLANAYAQAGLGEAAWRHAERALALAEAYATDLKDWDWAFALDCAARANAVAGRPEAAEHYRTAAREAADEIADPEDRAVVEAWFAVGS